MSQNRLNLKNESPIIPGNLLSNNKSLRRRFFHILNSISSGLSLTPSPRYSALNHLRSRSIGIMLPNLNNTFYTEVLRGIESITIKAGFSLFVCPAYKAHEREARLLDDLLERKTGGLIVFSTPIFKTTELRKILTSLHVLSIQSDIKGTDNISVTDKQGMFEAANHLLKLGHKRIAYMSYDNNITALNNRLDGFKAALREHNVSFDETLVFKEHVTSSGYSTAKAMLSSKTAPTAIQCVNDHLAMGVYMAASDVGLTIPRDVSVSGFDNTMMSRLMIPNLTTVAQPAQEMGETAAQVIIKRIIGDDRTEPRSIVLPTTHIIRDSTAIACK